MKKLLTFLAYITFISFITFIQSCSEETTKPENHAPKIQSLSANPSTVESNSQTTLACVATDQDGDNLTITWSSQTGTFPNGNTGASVIWQAPSTSGNCSITAIVSDNRATDEGTVNVNVQDAGTAPQAPTLFSPANGAANISIPVALIWNASNTATSYTLQVSSDNSFTNLVYNQSGMTGTSYDVTTLTVLTTYYWRVNAANSYGTSGWSEIWNFTTASGGSGGIPCPGTPSVTYESKTYNTVLIGSQCWLKENLDVGTMIQGSDNASDNGTIEKYCYNNDLNNCSTYGGLYQWNEAMQYSAMPGTQGICPPGWHIPTLIEFETLKAAVNDDSNALKELGEGTGSGSGTNTSGFSALLAGGRGFFGNFGDLDNVTVFWSSTEYDVTYAYNLYLYYNDNTISLFNYNKVTGYSIRCIMD